jgi:hypothetical protein
MMVITKDTFNESSAMARTAMILVICRLLPQGWGPLPLVHSAFLCILLIPLFSAARPRQGLLSSLGKLYIGMDCGTLLASLLGIFGLYFLWAPLAYRAWLASFGPHCPSRVCSTAFIRRVEAFKKRVAKIRIVCEFFGVGYLESHGLRGLTNINAIQNCIVHFTKSAWWWFTTWNEDRPFRTVVKNAMKYEKDR